MPTISLPSSGSQPAPTQIRKSRSKTARGIPLLKVGRPPYQPTKEGRQMVTVFRANGVDVGDIAHQLGIDKKTLYAYFSEELAHGKATIVSRIGAQVIKRALAGDNSMIVFYLKNHGGDAWKDKQRLEHTGPNGAPLAPPNLIVRLMPMPDVKADEPGA